LNGKDMETQIEIAGEELPAVICPRCGAKLYPAALLRGHLAHHRARDVQYRRDLIPLRQTLKRMRKFAASE
jgi:hypothetical protein